MSANVDSDPDVFAMGEAASRDYERRPHQTDKGGNT